MIGDHESELRHAEVGRRANPQDVRALVYVLRALAALGRIDAVRVRFDSIAASEPLGGYDPGRAWVEAATDLRAHGHDAARREALDRALGWYAALPNAERARLRTGRAQALYAAERWDEARVLVDSIRLESPDDEVMHGLQGAIAARLGNTEETMRIDAELAAIDRPYSYGRPELWRAKIAAILGDREQAVSLLREAYEKGQGYGTRYLHDMDLESLRDYPPFEEWIRPKG
jgi:tetratricopeptide (TPR) repeat protein